MRPTGIKMYSRPGEDKSHETRSSAMRALSNGAEPERYASHPNVHVRRCAFMASGQTVTDIKATPDLLLAAKPGEDPNGDARAKMFGSFFPNICKRIIRHNAEETALAAQNAADIKSAEAHNVKVAKWFVSNPGVDGGPDMITHPAPDPFAPLDASLWPSIFAPANALARTFLADAPTVEALRKLEP